MDLSADLALLTPLLSVLPIPSVLCLLVYGGTDNKFIALCNYLSSMWSQSHFTKATLRKRQGDKPLSLKAHNFGSKLLQLDFARSELVRDMMSVAMHICCTMPFSTLDQIHVDGPCGLFSALESADSCTYLCLVGWSYSKLRKVWGALTL